MFKMYGQLKYFKCTAQLKRILDTKCKKSTLLTLKTIINVCGGPRENCIKNNPIEFIKLLKCSNYQNNIITTLAISQNNSY